MAIEVVLLLVGLRKVNYRMTKKEYENLVTFNKRLDAEISHIVEEIAWIKFPDSLEEPKWWWVPILFLSP